MKFKLIEEETGFNNRNSVSGSAIEAMKSNLNKGPIPEVGIFRYNTGANKLFDVYSTPVNNAEWYQSTQWNTKVRTDQRMHVDIWRKNSRSGDHTMVPRGRVFQFEDGTFKVMVGSWIKKYPQAMELIIREFNLPEETTEFRVDEHWDLGRGWSDEF